jgi:hypothetical protein
MALSERARESAGRRVHGDRELGWAEGFRLDRVTPMAYTYQFEAHLREHRPSRLGQRVWWMPAAVGIAVVIADGIYLAATPLDQVSAALAVPLLFFAAFLFLLAWAALSVADWSYASEKRYREVQHTAASEVRAYVLAGRRSGGA